MEQVMELPVEQIDDFEGLLIARNRALSTIP
jgi:hypothetical protein